MDGFVSRKIYIPSSANFIYFPGSTKFRFKSKFIIYDLGWPRPPVRNLGA